MIMPMKKIIAFSALLLAGAVSACSDSHGNAVQDITAPAPSAKIKFFNFAVGAPSVNFYANDTKMTAISSVTGAESTLGVAYGSVGSGGLYTGIVPGQYTLKGKIAAATDKDLAISNLTAAIADGKAYSYYQSGVYNTSTKTTEAFIVEDPVPTVNYDVAYVRLVNAVYNSSPMTLYATSTVTGTESAIGSAVAYKGAGTFVALPPAVYNLNLRTSGSSTNLVTRASVSFLAGRVYTVGVRGDMTSSVAANKPFLDNTANY